MMSPLAPASFFNQAVGQEQERGATLSKNRSGAKAKIPLVRSAIRVIGLSHCKARVTAWPAWSIEVSGRPKNSAGRGEL